MTSLWTASCLHLLRPLHIESLFPPQQRETPVCLLLQSCMHTDGMSWTPHTLLRPGLDPELAFAHRSALSMGHAFVRWGPHSSPFSRAHVWSFGACLRVWSAQAPWSSVQGLLTACPATTTVYFNSVCINPVLITPSLQLCQIRAQDPVHQKHKAERGRPVRNIGEHGGPEYFRNLSFSFLLWIYSL